MNCKAIARMCLAAVALAAPLAAAADVTINVKASSAPYVHAWNNDGDLTTWPGRQLTDTKVHDGVTYYTTTFTNVSSVNIIISNNGSSKTGNIPDVAVSDAYFEYDNGRAWGTLPSSVVYDGGNTVYYVDIYRWGSVNAHVWNGNYSTTWPGEAMTKIGVDGAGYDVYKKTFSGLPGNIKFNDGTNQTGDGTFYAHGYYLNLGNQGENWWFFDAYTTITTSRMAITAANFSDTNFRAALGEELEIELDANNENATQAFSADEIEVLELTDKSITSLNGINHFTNLRELYAGENNISSTGLFDMSALSELEVLDVHGNRLLKGFNTTSGSAAAKANCFDIQNSTKLKYLDYSDCNFTYGLALTTWGITSLETIKLANNTNLGWTGFVSNQNALKYLDYSNCGLDNSSTNKPQFTASKMVTVEYLDLSNNSITSLSSLAGGLTSLKTLKVNNNTGLQYVGALSGAANLEHLEYRNIGLTQLSDLANCTKLQYLDISDNKPSSSNALSLTNHANLTTVIANNIGKSGYPYTTLTLTGNALTHIEADGSYINDLNLRNNLFTAIPDFTGNHILDVRVSGNPLPAVLAQELQGTFGLDMSGCTTLTSLDLSGSNISALMLGGMTALKTLKINNCQYLHKTAGNNTDTNLHSGTGCIYLADATSLETIEAANCNLSSDKLTAAQNPLGKGAESTWPFFTIPSGFTSLKSVDVSGNPGLVLVSSTDNAPNLEHLDMHDNVALVLTANQQLGTLTGTNNPKLASLDVSNCDLSAEPIVTGFPALATVNLAGNPKITIADFSHNALSSLDISGCTRLATLDVSYNDFDDIDFLDVQDCAVTDLDISHNNITSLSGISNASLVTLRINDSGLTSLAGVDNFTSLTTLYANSNAFAGALSLSGTSLEQIDLSANTGITSLDAKNNSLNSMLLQDCTGLTTLDVSGNKFVTTGTGTTLTSGMLNISDLALEELNLSDNLFTTIGASGSLAGMANTLTKLEARGNRFTAFVNGKAFPQVTGYHYTDESGQAHTVTRQAKPAVASGNHISDLTALEWLDLSGNEHLDSVCVFFNPALRHLDLSDCHNPDNHGLENRSSLRDYASSRALGLDIYHHGSAGSGGLYSLNLMKNSALEWLDISRTAIHETALAAVSCDRAYSEGGGYVYIHECASLDTLLCNDNGMNSLGLASNTNLRHVEVRRMNGNSYIMRDYGTNTGNINIHANVNGNANNIEYFDVSNSGFNGFGLDNNCTNSALKTLILDGNPLAGYTLGGVAEPGIYLHTGASAADCRTPNLETLSAKNCDDLTEVNVNYCQKLTDVDLKNCADLTEVNVNYCQALTSVDLTGSQKVTSLKMMNCIGLTEVPTLDRPALLQTLMCGYNTNLSDLDVTIYPALQTLNCQNDNIAELDLSRNLSLVDLYASNNRIEELEIPSTAIMNVAVDHNGMFKLNLGTAPNLTSLDFSDNHICAIDLSGTGNLLNPNYVFAENNSRTIKANAVEYYQDKGDTEMVTLYFFQLDDSETSADYNTQSILDATCAEANWSAHSMEDDGFVIANATFAGAVAGTRQNRVKSTADPSKLVADNIYGTIVPLDDSDDMVSYSYATGSSVVPTVTLGVNWEGNSTPTAVVDLRADRLEVYGEAGGVRVVAPEAVRLAVHDVSGRLVVVAEVAAGESRIALEPGVYVVAGVKVAVR